jgi:hypothetical protein
LGLAREVAVRRLLKSRFYDRLFVFRLLHKLKAAVFDPEMGNFFSGQQIVDEFFVSLSETYGAWLES